MKITINILKHFLSLISCLVLLNLNAQQPVVVEEENTIDYISTRDYTIAGITVTGATYFNHDAIKLIAELREGQKIKVPGEDISKAIRKLWDQKLFSDVAIDATKIIGDNIFLDIKVKERPRLLGLKSRGLRKKEFEKAKEKIDQFKGKIVTENMIRNIENIVRGHFIEKGYMRCKVKVTQELDTLKSNNMVVLVIHTTKGPKIKINNITFSGNQTFSDRKLRRLMKETKRKNFFRFWKTSKYLESNYQKDKQKIIDKLNDKGLRDATITSDSIWAHDSSTINIHLNISEGRTYYFRNITWIGNTVYRTGQLDSVLNIKRGDVYDQSLLDARLNMSQNGMDITSLYMDNGYLFFSIDPVEVRVEGDSIDFEIRIVEGKQARIKNVIIKGNTKTSDHVIRREIRTRPGDLFSRGDIIRTQRELMQLNLFNPEKMQVNPMPNPYEGTVDIEYIVEEKPSDQLQLSGGWGAGRLIGTLGVMFNNFSTNKFFKKEAWQPLPSGDGQTLSLQAQSTGQFYQGYNFSFTEPWLGGKKPNSLTFSVFHTFTSNDNLKRSDPNKSKLKITGSSLGLGKRLKWPDDYFTTYKEVNYMYYDLANYRGFFAFDNGFVNNINFRFTISRNSIDQPLYPRSGSSITLSARFTPPYSYFNNKNYSDLSAQERFKFLEYNKWKFTTSHFMALSKDKKLVLNARTGFGLLLPWNKSVGDSPFERFYLGGSGLTGFNMFFGREIIALRGYDDQTVSRNVGDIAIAKYTMELRYPVSLNPNATVFLLGFAEAGNTWAKIKDFNPFQVKRSAGLGVRIFLPMFGLLGLDYGWGFDPLEGDKAGAGLKKPGTGQFHFTIGMNLGEL